MSRSESTLTFSFVIPAFNEENYIGQAIDDIKSSFSRGQQTEYEILVVDNGSTDRTVDIVESAGCKCLIEPAMGISELRNRGAQESIGDIIVFIDSDVSLTRSWRKDVTSYIQRLVNGEREIIGSHYRPCESTPYPLIAWFIGGYENPRTTFLPGGHTIVSRRSFDEIGGFDPNFETSEDIDFCHRATAMGFKIRHCQELGVIHKGDPQTIWQFLKRECWHGGSDFASLTRVFRSRTSIATVIFLVAHLSILIAMLLGNWSLAIAALVILTLLTVGTSFHLFRYSSTRLKLINSANAYLYYVGRCCSIRALFFRSKRDRSN